MRSWLSVALAIAALSAVPGLRPGAAAAEDILIGTGSPNSIVFHVGRSICRLVERNATDLSCAPVATDGSLFNLSNLQTGGIEIALAQSDWHYHAYNKSGPYEFVDQGFEGLRSLFSVHSEAFTVVARRDSGIEGLDDLQGKRVNLGNPGSGQRATMDVVLGAKGWTGADFAVAQELTAAEHVLALCHDRVQAVTFMVGHPDPAVGKAVGLCGARLVTVSGPKITELVAATPYYSLEAIPPETYPANPDPVVTFGVKATVVSHRDIDKETIYQLVKAVFEDLETFKNYHPAFQGLEAGRMIREGLTAPLHEGALRYYREIGLM